MEVALRPAGCDVAPVLLLVDLPQLGEPVGKRKSTTNRFTYMCSENMGREAAVYHITFLV